MSSFTLNPNHGFPVGTDVDAWEDVGQNPHSRPAGSVADTATVDASGGLAFTGLEEGVRYIVGATVGGSWQAKRLYVQRPYDEYEGEAGTPLERATVVALRRLAASDESPLNVQWPEFGAAGDDLTDDAAAFQAAVDALPDSGGAILVPLGSYRFGSYVTVDKPVAFIGAGATLKLADTFTPGSEGQGVFFLSAAGEQSTFHGFRFDGNKDVLAAHTNNWFIRSRAPWLRVYDCRFEQLGSPSAAVSTIGGTSGYAKVYGCEFEDLDGGAVFFQSPHSRAWGNVAKTIGDVGFTANTYSSIGFEGNTVELCAPQAAFATEEGAYDWVITGNTIRSCCGALKVNDNNYVGAIQGGGIFANNVVTDTTKGSSVATENPAIHLLGPKTGPVKIVNNIFSGLASGGSVAAFVYVQLASDGLTIEGNTFEAKAQAIQAAVLLQPNLTFDRLSIKNNTIRSTSSGTKLQRGIWIGDNCVLTKALIADNLFENITGSGVDFGSGVSFAGALENNRADSSVQFLYGGSPWGATIAPAATVLPHTLRNSAGRSRWNASAAPVAGTWIAGDIVWNFAPSAGGPPGWMCTTAGTPGTWKAMASLAA